MLFFVGAVLLWPELREVLDGIVPRVLDRKIFELRALILNSFGNFSFELMSKSTLVKEILLFIDFSLRRPYVYLGFLFLWPAIKNKSEATSKQDLIDQVLEKFEIIHKEKTDKPEFETVRGRRQRKLDENGKPVYKIKQYKPSINFSGLPSSIRISNVHEKVYKNFQTHADALIRELYELDMIDRAQGIVKTGERPREFLVDLLSEKQFRDITALDDVGWFAMRGANKQTKLYPKVIDLPEERKIILDCKNCKIQDEKLTKGIKLFAQHYDVELKKSFTREGNKVILHYAKILEPIFPFGLAINETEESRQKFKKHFIDEIVALKNKKGTEHLIAGELFDPERNVESKIILDLGTNPHFLIGGQTASGKTKTLMSLLLQASCAYLDAEFVMADGKNSKTLENIADTRSKFPVAIITTDNHDPLVQFVNILNYTNSVMLQRRKMRESLGFEYGIKCENYREYNEFIDSNNIATNAEFVAARFTRDENGSPTLVSKGTYPRMHRLFLVVDEMAEFIKELKGNVQDLVQKKGNAFSTLRSLLAASRSEGISIILASQRLQATDFPTPIRDNLNNWLIHSVTTKSAEFAGTVKENTELESGAYVLKAPGIFDSVTKENNIICRLPYVGDSSDIKELIQYYGAQGNSLEKRDFDNDIITNIDDNVNISKKDVHTLAKEVRRLFFKNEDFEILENHDPLERIVYLCGTKEHFNNIPIGVVIVDNVVELEESFNFSRTLKNERSDLRDLIIVILCMQDRLGSKTKLGITNLLPRARVFLPHEYRRALKESLTDYLENRRSFPFTRFIMNNFQDILMDEGIVERELNRPSLNSEQLETLEMDKEDLVIQDDKEQLTKRDIALKIVTKENLVKIKRIKNSDTKGKSFERFCLALELLLGHESESSYKLIQRGKMQNLFGNTRKDGGLDIVRWIDHEKRIVDIIQCKNQPSRPLDDKVLAKMTETAELYKNGDDLTIRNMIIYSSGRLTRPAMEKAKLLGIQVFANEKLNYLIEEVNPTI